VCERKKERKKESARALEDGCTNLTLERAKREKKRRRKTILGRKLKICSLESAICALQDCLNPIFLGGVFTELLFYEIFGSVYQLFVCDRKRVRR
jgi:hypothetical protein